MKMKVKETKINDYAAYTINDSITLIPKKKCIKLNGMPYHEAYILIKKARYSEEGEELRKWCMDVFDINNIISSTLIPGTSTFIHIMKMELLWTEIVDTYLHS